MAYSYNLSLPSARFATRGWFGAFWRGLSATGVMDFRLNGTRVDAPRTYGRDVNT